VGLLVLVAAVCASPGSAPSFYQLAFLNFGFIFPFSHVFKRTNDKQIITTIATQGVLGLRGNRIKQTENEQITKQKTKQKTNKKKRINNKTNCCQQIFINETENVTENETETKQKRNRKQKYMHIRSSKQVHPLPKSSCIYSLF
jgi:hypothetical protein